MHYLLIFAINTSSLVPVTLKNCIPYKSVEAMRVQDLVSDIEDSGSECSKAHDMTSWTCKNQKFVSKVVVLTNQQECRSFPETAAKSMKLLVNK